VSPHISLITIWKVGNILKAVSEPRIIKSGLIIATVRMLPFKYFEIFRFREV